MKRMALPFLILTTCFALSSCKNSPQAIAKNDSTEKMGGCGCSSKCGCNDGSTAKENHCGCGPNCGK